MKDANDEERERQEELIEKFVKKLESFCKHLEFYPALGLSHEMGKKIYKEIFASEKIPIAVSSHWKWSRARMLKHSRVFQQSDMVAPGIGLSSGGDFIIKVKVSCNLLKIQN